MVKNPILYKMVRPSAQRNFQEAKVACEEAVSLLWTIY